MGSKIETCDGLLAKYKQLNGCPCNISVEMQSIFLHCERALAVVVYCNAMQCNEIYFLAMRLCIGSGGGAMWCSLFVLGHNAPFSNSHSLLQSASCCNVFANILSKKTFFRRKSKSRSETNPNAIWETNPNSVKN